MEEKNNINIENRNLFDAYINNNLEDIEKALENGADIKNAKSDDGMTFLMIASIRGDIERAQFFLEHGVDIEAKDDGGETALILAVAAKDSGMIQFLLDNGADIEAKDNTGDTALEWAVWKKDKEMVQLLLDNGANIEATNDKGETPLIKASSNGHIEIVKLLLDNSSNINKTARNKIWMMKKLPIFLKFIFFLSYLFSKRNALYYAIKNNHNNVAKLLIDYGAKINEDTLKIAIKNNNKEIVEIILIKWTWFKKKYIFNDFHFSSIDSKSIIDSKILVLLIKHGLVLDINGFEDIANTPKIAKIFIENVKNKKILHKYYAIAQSKNQIEILKLLETNNVDFGKNSFDVKLINKNRNIFMKIESYLKRKLSKYLINHVSNKEDLNIENINLMNLSLPLIISIQDDYPLYAIEMLLKTDINIDSQDKEGMTALMWACKLEKVEIVKLLLKYRANPTIEDNQQKIALQYSLHNKEITPILRNHKIKKSFHNPQELVQLLSNFTIDTPIKYSTHLWDFGDVKKEYGSFQGFMEAIKNQWQVIEYELKELSPNLHDKIYNFLINDEPNKSWCSQADINIGWSSLDGLEEWCDGGNNPFDFKLDEEYEVDGKSIGTFGEVISLFKQEIEIRNENNVLEEIFLEQKKKLGRGFKIELKKLKGKSFYTDVEIFKNSINSIFNEIRKRPQNSEIEVEAISKDSKIIEIKIIQLNSQTGRDASDMLDEVKDGDFKILKDNFQNLCDWSIESAYEDRDYRINYLRDLTTQEIEPLDETSNGFTHILRFYK